MLDILKSLEPLRVPKDTILFNELEDINEVYFFIKGQCKIGYEINGITRMVITNRKPNGIGAYGLTFNKRSQFIYKTSHNCKGYFIRKEHWKHIIDDNPLVSNELKGQILKEYERTVRSKINILKKRDVAQMSKRADQEYFKFVSSLNDQGQILSPLLEFDGPKLEFYKKRKAFGLFEFLKTESVK